MKNKVIRTNNLITPPITVELAKHPAGYRLGYYYNKKETMGVDIGSRRNLRILRDAINKELNSEYNIALSRLCNKKDKVISGKKLKKEVEAK